MRLLALFGVVVAAASLIAGPPATAIAAVPGSTFATATYTYDAPALLASLDTVASHAPGSPPRPGAASRVSPAFVGDCGVAAKTAASGADDVLNGVRLRAQLTGEEISGGHAFQKHVLDQAEFPGITTRQQFAGHIEDVVLNGEMRTLSGGRTSYWQDGTVVIRNPGHVDGGTAFRPTSGYDYFLNLH